MGGLPKDGLDKDTASNYPNPFDSRKEDTTFNFQLRQSADFSIKIYSVYGRLVKELNTNGIAGSNEIRWDGTDDSGRKVSKGLYLAVVESGGAKVILKVGVIH